MRGKSPKDVSALLGVPYPTVYGYRTKLVNEGKLQPLSKKKGEPEEGE